MRVRAVLTGLLIGLIAVAVVGCGGTDDGDAGPTGPIGPVVEPDLGDADRERVVGSGEIATITRELNGFQAVVLAGEGDVTVSFADESGIVITTDDNLLELIETTVVDDVLEIRLAADTDIDPSDGVSYDVTTTELSSVALSGTGTIVLPDWTEGASSISLSGVGDISAAWVDATELTVDVTGVGSVTLNGRVEDQDVVVGGLGEYLAGDLRSATAFVEATEDGVATLWVTDDLTVTAAGTSSVSYHGSPEVTQQTEGLATVTALGVHDDEDDEAATVPASSEEIMFSSGRFELAGTLTLPGGPGPHPAVVLVHGSGPQTRSSTPTWSDVVDRFGDAGFATLAWDKPGSGSSTGWFDEGETLRQRASILLDGVDVLGERPDIDAARIGVWGLSQAGWVMPIALQASDGIAFMIVVSGGGEDSIDQLAYQLGRDAVCRGLTEQEGDLIETWFPPTAKGETYEDYLAAMDVLMQVDGWEDFAGPALKSEIDWQPWPSEIDAHFDPMTVIERTTIPVLAVFGDMDRYVDPVQGATAYEQALATAGNADFHVELLSGVGHTMQEQTSMCASGGGRVSPRYLELLDEWAAELAS